MPKELMNNYKECLVIKKKDQQIYRFEFKEIKGMYSIDSFDNKWMSISAISSILKDSVYEKFRSKYFDLDKDNQQQFFYISNIVSAGDKEIKFLFDCINSNTRQGTPRKFLLDSKNNRINIQLPMETISKLNF